MTIENINLAASYRHIFVLGPTNVGKTTFCNRLIEEMKQQSPVYIKASGWVREKAGVPVDAHGDDVTAKLTQASQDMLRHDPDISYFWLRREMARNGDDMTFVDDEYCPMERNADDITTVIDGVRSPFDFARAFNPKTDCAVMLHRADIKPINAFEAGIDIIVSQLAWYEQCLSRRLLYHVHL